MNRLRNIVITTGLALGAVSCVESVPAIQAPVTQAAPPPIKKPVSTPDGKVTRIALGDLFPLQQSGEVLLYDVRPSFYHSLGHIPGSVNWPKSSYASQLPAREAEIRAAQAAGRPVVLYCTDLACPDARGVASQLASRGHSVKVLEGGWEAWKAGGLPTD
jgi:rhodanese-related sulfurtransferase